MHYGNCHYICQAWLTSYQTDYFIKQDYVPLLYKTVTSLAIIDSRITDQQLHDNLGDLVIYIVFCKLDIKKFHLFFNADFSALIVRGKTVDNSISSHFDKYFAADDYMFVKYMKDTQVENFEKQAHLHNWAHGYHNCLLQLPCPKKWEQKLQRKKRVWFFL